MGEERAVEAARRRVILIKAAVGLLFLLIVLAVYNSPLRQSLTHEKIVALRDTARAAWYGPPLFVFLYAVGCTFLIPATLFILAAGAIWGWWLGGLYALAGAALGSLASYYFARFVGGGVIGRFGKAGASLAAKLEGMGFNSFLILRLIPLFPFFVLNYAAGIARIRPRVFLLATIIGTAPSHFVVAYSADALLAGTISREQAMQRVVIVVLLVLTVFGVPALLKRRAQKTLHLDEANDA